MNAPIPQALTPADLVEEYLRLKDAKKAAEDKIKKFVAENYSQRLEQIEAILQDTLNKLGGDSIKTPHGTAFTRTETSVTVSAQSEFSAFVIGNESWELVDFRANKTAVREFLENNDGHLPPGINMTEVKVISVRRPS